MNVVVISREEAPGSYARLIVNRKVGTLSWSELRLDPEEVALLAPTAGNVSREDIEHLYALCDGWVAGFVLLVDQLRRGASFAGVGTSMQASTLFDYFAGQVLERLDPMDQQVLLRAGFFPYLTGAMLQDASGTPTAGCILEHLYRRHLFTDRRPATSKRTPGPTQDHVYQLHPLFRAFLQERARTALAPEAWQATSIRAGRLLESHAAPMEALDCYYAAGAWEHAQQLLLKESEALIEQGRWQSVLTAVDTFPAAVVANSPSLSYWRGMARISADVERARQELELARCLAQEHNEQSREIDAIAGIMQTYFVRYETLAPLDFLIPEMERLLLANQAFPTITRELRVLTAMIFALVYRQPAHPILPALVERVAALAPRAVDLNAQISAYTQLCIFGLDLGRFDVCRRVLPELERLATYTEILAVNRVMAYRAIGYTAEVQVEPDPALRAVGQGVDLALSAGLNYAVANLCVMAALPTGACGRYEVSRHWIDVGLKHAEAGGLGADIGLNGAQAILAIAQGDALQAERFSTESLRQAEKFGLPSFEAWALAVALWSWVENGALKEAQRGLDRLRTLCGEANVGWPLCWLHAVEAQIARRQGDLGALQAAAARTFRICRELDCGPLLRYYGAWASRLCHDALRANIETSYVKQLIAQCAFRPPTGDTEHWPWAIRIYALGRFSIVRNNALLTIMGKVPKRPLQVLQAIVCAGPEGVTTAQLIDALWPDSEGDLGYQALKAAIARVRKLLQDPDAVLVADSRLRLNSNRVWVDVFDFDYLVRELGDDQSMRRAIDLYHGLLLPDLQDHPWTFPARERARGAFFKAIAVVAEDLERSAQWQRALEVYQAGSSADELVESFYQGAMRCLLAMGRKAEAKLVFQRAERTLSRKLGVSLAPETELLHRQTR